MTNQLTRQEVEGVIPKPTHFLVFYYRLGYEGIIFTFCDIVSFFYRIWKYSRSTDFKNRKVRTYGIILYFYE